LKIKWLKQKQNLKDWFIIKSFSREITQAYKNRLLVESNYREWWKRGYRACGQQYELNLPPDGELDWRYNTLKESGKLETASSYGLTLDRTIAKEDEIEYYYNKIMEHRNKIYE
jgi:hypothetical protein